MLVRTPSVMVSAALGAGLISWRSPWFIAGAMLFIVLGILAGLNEQRIESWLSRQVRRQPQRATPANGSPDEAAAPASAGEQHAGSGLSSPAEVPVGSSEG